MPLLLLLVLLLLVVMCYCMFCRFNFVLIGCGSYLLRKAIELRYHRSTHCKRAAVWRKSLLGRRNAIFPSFSFGFDECAFFSSSLAGSSIRETHIPSAHIATRYISTKVIWTVYIRKCARACLYSFVCDIQRIEKKKKLSKKRVKRSFTERIIERIRKKNKLINLNDREQNIYIHPICQKRPKAIFIQISFSECGCGWVHFPTGIHNRSVCPNAESFIFLTKIQLIYHFFVYFFFLVFIDGGFGGVSKCHLVTHIGYDGE